jgi:predicted RNA-binding protein associated with RNAse of E/G family
VERKFANHPGWKRILQSRYSSMYLDTPQFTGYVTLYRMDAVVTPLVVHYFGRDTCIVDAGYAWMKQFPDGEHFTITTHFDRSGAVVLWYIDICLRTGVSEDGIPWLDDLYLDLAVSPDFQVEVLDVDEILEARECGEITAEEYELAWNEANRLVERIKNRALDLLELIPLHRQMVEAN